MAAKMAMINLGEPSQRPMHRLAAETRVCLVARPARRESGIPTTRSPLWGLAWPGLNFESPIPAALCWERGKRGLGDSHSVPVSAYPDLITMDGAARFGVGRGAPSKAIAECPICRTGILCRYYDGHLRQTIRDKGPKNGSQVSTKSPEKQSMPCHFHPAGLARWPEQLKRKLQCYHTRAV